MKNAALPLLLVPTLLSIPAFGQIQSEFLGVDEGARSIGYCISDDGQTIAGMAIGSSVWSTRPFRWTSSDGIEWLAPSFDGYELVDLSADGRIVVINTLGGVCFRVNESGQRQYLGTLGGSTTGAEALSEDGSTIVGRSQRSDGRLAAFAWTESGGLMDLGDLGTTHMSAGAVSADGSVIVGAGASQPPVSRFDTNREPVSNATPFRWTAQTGLVPLPGSGEPREISADGHIVYGRRGYIQMLCWVGNALPVVFAQTAPIAGVVDAVGGPFISADGSVASWYNWRVGISGNRWSPTLGYLSNMAGIETAAFSADGSVAIGGGYGDFQYRWTEALGRIQLGDSDDYSPRFGISANGDWMTGSENGRAVRWNIGEEIGARYCGPAITNSGGRPAVLRITGTNQIARNDAVLRAHSLPANAAGYFLASQASGETFPVSQSQGRLCLAGAIGRFSRPHQIQNSGADGRFDFDLPLQGLATPSGPTAATAGSTWNFQAWFRDANPHLTSNFTNGVRLTVY